MSLWIRKVWNTRPKSASLKHSLLVFDHFAAHLTEEIKKRLTEKKRIDLPIIPDGFALILQQLDRCINKVFKAYLKELWADWIANSEHSLPPS